MRQVPTIVPGHPVQRDRGLRGLGGRARSPDRRGRLFAGAELAGGLPRCVGLRLRRQLPPQHVDAAAEHEGSISSRYLAGRFALITISIRRFAARSFFEIGAYWPNAAAVSCAGSTLPASWR